MGTLPPLIINKYTSIYHKLRLSATGSLGQKETNSFLKLLWKVLGSPTLTPINPAQLVRSYWELHGLCSGKLGLILCHLNIFVHYLAHTQKHLEMYSGHRPNWIICLHFPHDLKLQLLQQAVGFLFSFLNSFFSLLLKSQQSDFKPLTVAWLCVCFLRNGSCRHTRWEKKFPTTSLRAALQAREKTAPSGRDTMRTLISEMLFWWLRRSVNPALLSPQPLGRHGQEWHPPAPSCPREQGTVPPNQSSPSRPGRAKDHAAPSHAASFQEHGNFLRKKFNSFFRALEDELSLERKERPNSLQI